VRLDLFSLIFGMPFKESSFSRYSFPPLRRMKPTKLAPSPFLKPRGGYPKSNLSTCTLYPIPTLYTRQMLNPTPPRPARPRGQSLGSRGARRKESRIAQGRSACPVLYRHVFSSDIKQTCPPAPGPARCVCPATTGTTLAPPRHHSVVCA
jgi:hypothetical protein